ncbi:hypothetical protein RchiOBHm_Chr3g0478621 [Rosa chinensis]|uniref:Uncharacterized protein n=1 Tax=Rosa chinensis TaxID=74649 RepID=A0A2P6RD85_ROSCH|nr:hypothetical protein RchiOBHm_Chr3g0478621 [Rosa chinensis]
MHLKLHTDDVLPSLEEQRILGSEQELQLHILELADILVERPSQYAEESGRNISYIQELASSELIAPPSGKIYWARVTLIHILELQIKRRKQVVEDIKRYVLNNY